MRESIIEKIIAMEIDSYDSSSKKKKEELIAKRKESIESMSDDALIEELIDAAKWAGKLEEWRWD